MVATGVIGQSLADDESRTVLFGGFDDHFLRYEAATGRTSAVSATGRIALFPWDDDRFIALEDALGRPSRTRVSLRAFSDPALELDGITAATMPAEFDKPWSSSPCLIPGHYPTAFRVGGGVAEEITASFRAPPGRVGFVAGVFAAELAISVDGRIEAFDDGAGNVRRIAVPAAAAVGCGKRLWLAAGDELIVVAGQSRRIVASHAAGQWRPHAIEHHPASGAVLVASWNRWGSLGAPTTDVYVFRDGGGPIGECTLAGLVDRLAFVSGSVVGRDVVGNVVSQQLRFHDR